MAAPHKNRSKASDPLYEKTRAKIKVSQLVNRLNANALGTLTNSPGRALEEGEERPIAEMTAGQIRSAEILLNKTLPNLQSTTIASDPDNPLQITVNPSEKLRDFLDEQSKRIGDASSTAKD